MRLAKTPTIPFEFDLAQAQLLAALLLNPRADRSTIWFCIVISQPLVDFLTQYESIVIQAKSPKPPTRVHGDKLDFREFQFTGFKWKSPTPLPYWPAIVGMLNDQTDVPWFQSSPKEFVPTSPNIWTTNKHTRTPELTMLSMDSESVSRAFLANTITLPRGKRIGQLGNPSARSQSISANAKS